MKMDNQALQFVMAMQKALCDLLQEIDQSSAREQRARWIAQDAARIIKAQGQQPEEVPESEAI